jgi:hypothetical protein
MGRRRSDAPLLHARALRDLVESSNGIPGFLFVIDISLMLDWPRLRLLTAILESVARLREGARQR